MHIFELSGFTSNDGWACAKCDFYAPKNSVKAQLVEAKGNLQKMLVSIPLTDDERAVVDVGRADRLLGRLAEVPAQDQRPARSPSRRPSRSCRSSR